jgi:putative membrane protein
MMYHYPGFGFAGGWMFMLLWIVIFVAVVYLVVSLVNRAGHRSHSFRQGPDHRDLMSQSPDAEQILKERYARGEIDTETFLSMKKHLKD